MAAAMELLIVTNLPHSSRFASFARTCADFRSLVASVQSRGTSSSRVFRNDAAAPRRSSVTSVDALSAKMRSLAAQGTSQFSARRIRASVGRSNRRCVLRSMPSDLAPPRAVQRCRSRPGATPPGAAAMSLGASVRAAPGRLDRVQWRRQDVLY